jgi:trans-aconitate methyltransferase
MGLHPVLDVGGGASRLVDVLVAREFADVTVLDVSDEGLTQARRRLGDPAVQVEWITADLLSWRPTRRYRAWHDRAAFHFLTDPADQVSHRALQPGGAGRWVGGVSCTAPNQAGIQPFTWLALRRL